MQKILIIRLKAIGDVVFTLPALGVLRERFPEAKITFLTSQENASLLRGFGMINEVIALHRAALRSGNPLKMIPEFFALITKLCFGKFDLVVDFQGYGETAWLTWLTGAKQRWGSVYGAGRAWAYTQAIPRQNNLQIADWNLSLLKQCGLQVNEIRNAYHLPGDAQDSARELFIKNRLDPRRQTLFIQAFTSTPHKNWPLKNYLSLAAHCRKHKIQVIFGGGQKDIANLEPARKAGHVVIAGCSLLTSAGLVKLSTVAIGGVTGLLHLAVAMQKRTVMLIGPVTEPGFPYQHRDWGVLPPFGDRVADIKLSTVIDACSKAFNELEGNASW